ncbi:adenosylcobinamide-GDP ribazoletransferase [Oricola thermophila]|nr:adenosylcobinamide-GDP ribazoletransferase [Oricola thermophila]
MRDDSAAFAFAGTLIGILPALALVLLTTIGVPPFMSATFAVMAMAAITGALHEDGLGDVADGFGGASDRESRLEIMKDSRIGTYGAIAVAGTLLLRSAGLGAIVAAHGSLAAAFALIAVAACSRAAIVWFWASLPSARPGGVADSAGSPRESAVSMAAISGLAIFAVVATAAIGFLNAAIAILLAIAAMQGFSRLCMRMLGGQTGDTLGACQQIVEILLYTGLALGIAIPT